MTLTLKTNYHRAFKEADVRGIYPTEIDGESVYFIARAFVEEFKYTKIIVAKDMRLSTPALHEAFIKGANDSGATVVDIGLVHSPVLYFASNQMNLPGVMITASHSPKDYNGLKLVHAGAIPLTEKFGLGKIRRRIEKGKFIAGVKVGKVIQKKVLPAWQKFIFKGYKVKNLTGLKVAVDVGNGMTSVAIPLLKEKLPVELDVLFPDLDGSFPNRDSDPTLLDNQRFLREKLSQEKYDFGVAFDGDGDRVAFLDETGNYINSAVMGALIAERLLQKTPQAKIGYTALTSRSYSEAVKTAGGKPIIMRVGHAFIKESMRKKDVLFACEHSGHFYFKDYFYTDSVVMTLMLVLEAYAEAKSKGQTFADMIAPYIKYQQTEDVIVMVKDKELAIKKTEAYLKTLNPKSIKQFDGLMVDFGNVWGVVKVSVTEYALKIMFEGEKLKEAKAMQRDLVRFVKSIAKDTQD